MPPSPKPTNSPSPKRGRGRPPGSKNKLRRPIISKAVRPEAPPEVEYSQFPRQSYSPSEFGQIHGFSKATTDRLIAAGRIRSFKVGRLRRIPASENERLAGGGAE